MKSEIHAALEALAKRRWRLALVLTLAMVTSYFGFLLLIAYGKPFMGTQIAPGLSVGIVIGAGLIVLAWILTGIYVRWANRTYDTELGRLRRALADVDAGASPESR